MAGGLLEDVEALRGRLGGDLLPFALPRAGDDRGALRELTGQLDDYVLPRLRAIDAPLLAVVGGSTGAGKSTLVNSLVGADVTEPGVLRPTTLVPTLVTAPADAPWFTAQHILPGMPRVTGGDGNPGRSPDGSAGRPVLRVVVAGALRPGLALLDAPDIDSVVTENRALAAQLLAAADLWLFVTTAARYADEVPWGYLREAGDRSTALAIVLDRVPPEGARVVAADLARLMRENGLGGARLFEVPEVALPEENARLPAEVVRPIAEWLSGIAADAEARAQVVRQTLAGALAGLATRVPALADAVDRQLAAERELRRAVTAAYDEGMARFDAGMRDGALLRGEVLARWQDFVGTGDLMRGLESRVGRLRDRLGEFVTGRPASGARLRVALESGLESLIRDAADGSAERAYEAWSADPAGRDLLERAGVGAAGRLARAAQDLPERAEATVRAWQGYVLDLVRQEGQGRRTAARLASYGVNGTGLLLMIAVFASTGGLTGIEVGIAGGTSVLSQKLLEAVFGDQAVRTLTAKARDDLRRRVRVLLDEDASRFTARLDAVRPAGDAPGALRAAASTLRTHLPAVRHG
ncbi:energy-coupling factor transporter ATP-binding protein EcfA2 [Thermocatellispora tengchongensis]|uniref:Energy-coupling factor transporter ATP-binding protein EcfA2 n=1 Tax=Thermocatellispora tengchongensis TaxID=1073253 RepID=A0A840PP99_9ACTN|nr:ABC transporter [Thermocatellispora tengchongensis]MBB5139540.1 energy-coupling factor transporter ATP-binding protein EcfA2 [Thermocatellispora tengchongensis]